MMQPLLRKNMVPLVMPVLMAVFLAGQALGCCRIGGSIGNMLRTAFSAGLGDPTGGEPSQAACHHTVPPCHGADPAQADPSAPAENPCTHDDSGCCFQRAPVKNPGPQAFSAPALLFVLTFLDWDWSLPADAGAEIALAEPMPEGGPPLYLLRQRLLI